MISTILRFIRNDKGATAIEYGMIAALVAVAIIAGVTAMGGELGTLFGTIEAALKPPA